MILCTCFCGHNCGILVAPCLFGGSRRPRRGVNYVAILGHKQYCIEFSYLSLDQELTLASICFNLETTCHGRRSAILIQHRNNYGVSLDSLYTYRGIVYPSTPPNFIKASWRCLCHCWSQISCFDLMDCACHPGLHSYRYAVSSVEMHMQLKIPDFLAIF